MALATSQPLDDLTVAELRRMARDRGLKGYSKMKKADLVKALAGADETGSGQQDQVPPARPHDETMPAGENRTTADHNEIQAWADARNAVPAMAQGAREGTPPRILRFRFPGAPADNLDQVDWPTWFHAFDTLGLRFIYLVPSDGSQSKHFQLERRSA